MPTMAPIPAWNVEGLIPPADLANPASANRAPYPVALSDLVLRFCTSTERRTILEGLPQFDAGPAEQAAARLPMVTPTAKGIP